MEGGHLVSSPRGIRCTTVGPWPPPRQQSRQARPAAQHVGGIQLPQQRGQPLACIVVEAEVDRTARAPSPAASDHIPSRRSGAVHRSWGATQITAQKWLDDKLCIADWVESSMHRSFRRCTLPRFIGALGRIVVFSSFRRVRLVSPHAQSRCPPHCGRHDALTTPAGASLVLRPSGLIGVLVPGVSYGLQHTCTMLARILCAWHGPLHACQARPCTADRARCLGHILQTSDCYRRVGARQPPPPPGELVCFQLGHASVRL